MAEHIYRIENWQSIGGRFLPLFAYSKQRRERRKTAPLSMMGIVNRINRITERINAMSFGVDGEALVFDFVDQIYIAFEQSVHIERTLRHVTPPYT